MGVITNRAACEHTVFSDAQQRFEFTVDPDIDILPGAGADEMQPFHGGLRVKHGSDGEQSSFTTGTRWPKFEFYKLRGHSVVNGEILA
jgi:hypothetical protein